MPKRKNITRGLRFTLTAVYTVVFTLLLVGVSLLFRQNLANSLETGARDDLDQNWAIVKAYLRIENDSGQRNYHPLWFADPNDPDEQSAVASVKKVYVIADADGNILGPDGSSTNYKSLGLGKPSEIRSVLQSQGPVWTETTDSKNVPYLIRSSYVYGEEDTSKKFYIAIGTSLADSRRILNRFTLQGLILLPLVILTGIVIG